MVLFKTDGQLMILPAIGFVRDGDDYCLNISWLCWGLNICVFTRLDQ